MCLKKYNVFECWKQRSITRCQQLLVFGWIKSVFLALNQTSAHQGCRVFCLFWVIIKWRERDNKITRPGSWHVNEEWDKLPLSPVWNVDVSSFGMREAGKSDRLSQLLDEQVLSLGLSRQPPYTQPARDCNFLEYTILIFFDVYKSMSVSLLNDK